MGVITDLFSAIDFNSNLISYVYLRVFFYLITNIFYFSFNNYIFKINKILNLSEILKNKIRKNACMFILTFVLFININGNIPHTTPLTSNLFLVLSISLFFFILINISNLIFDIKKYIIHFAPRGAPR